MKNIIITMMLMLCLTSCGGTEAVNERSSENTAGFFTGVWHGVISPLSFIGSLCSDEITIMNPTDNGPYYKNSAYPFGFVVIMIVYICVLAIFVGEWI